MLETGPLGAEATELDLEILAAEEAIEGAMRSEEAGVDLMDRERVWTAIAAHRAWRPAEVALEVEAAEEGSEEAAEVVAVVAAVDGADSDDDG